MPPLPLQLFNANYDGDTLVTNDLPCPVFAKCVRINPTLWTGYIAMRFDVLGC